CQTAPKCGNIRERWSTGDSQISTNFETMQTVSSIRHPNHNVLFPRKGYPCMIDTQPNASLSSSESNESKIPAPLAEQIRRLSHDLSNALEVIMQTNYLLGMSGESGLEESAKWREMLDRGVMQATQINRQLRDFVRSNS